MPGTIPESLDFVWMKKSFEPAIARFPTEPVRDEVRTALDAHLDDVPDTFA